MYISTNEYKTSNRVGLIVGPILFLAVLLIPGGPSGPAKRTAAVAMQKWNLHRRIALQIIAFLGASSERLMLNLICSVAVAVYTVLLF